MKGDELYTPKPVSHTRALVVGATGFLGSHLCRRLLREQAEVHAVSRTAQTGTAGTGLRYWQCDATDPTAVQKLVEQVRPDVVYHLGGVVTALSDLDFVLPTFQTLLASTVNILHAVTAAGAGRVVLAGSLEEPTGSGAVVPTSPYAAAKLAASSYARMFADLYGTPVVNLRTFSTYGPAQKPAKVVPYTILSLLRGAAPNLAGGDRAQDWVFIDDVVEAYVAAAENPDVDGRTLDVGTGTAVRLRDIADRLTRLIDPSITPRYADRPDRVYPPLQVADVGTTAAVLNWSATTPLDRGLERTVEWYRNQGFSR